MSIWKLLAAPFNKIVDSIGDAIDKNATTAEEKLRLKNELAKLLADAEQHAAELEFQYEKELTERHKADMVSDVWLAKNIRPLSLVFLLTVISLLAVTDGNLVIKILSWNIDWAFQIKQPYIDLFQGLLLMVFGFYFGSRGVEKVIATIMDKKRKG